MSRNFNGYTYISNSYVYVYKYQTIFVWICVVWYILIHYLLFCILMLDLLWSVNLVICLNGKKLLTFACVRRCWFFIVIFFLLYNFSINFYILFIKKCFSPFSPRSSVITSLIQRLLSTRTKPGYVSPVIALFFIELALNSRTQLLVTLSL